MLIVDRSEIEIIYVNNYYDYPLVGICRYMGKTYQFDLHSEWGEEETIYVLKELKRWLKFKKWVKRTWFGICVGWHWHYKNGRRSSHFYYKWPQWFWKWVFKMYYKPQKNVEK